MRLQNEHSTRYSKNIFRKYPVASLGATNFVVVWLLPLFVMVGFNTKALWGGGDGVLGERPLYCGYIY